MNLALVQPLYRDCIRREYTRISIEGTIRSWMGRRYWPARTALCAFCTEKGFIFLNSSCQYLLENIHLELVQPLYRARKSCEWTRISFDGLTRRCMGRWYWPTRTALCAFCTERWFRYLKSSCTLLQDNIHLPLVQPLYRAWISRECTRISIVGTIRRCVGLGWPVQLCAPFARRKGLHF